MVPGAELWWTETAGGCKWVIADVVPAGSGSRVNLVLQTNRISNLGFPVVGRRACFSQLNTKPGYELFLPSRVPWTHMPATPPEESNLDYDDAGGRAA